MNSQLDQNTTSDDSTFDPQMAADNPNYLEENASAAGAFANMHLVIGDPHLYQSLYIKGGLEEKIDLNLLRALFSSADTEARKQVLFYLARVSVPELDEELISFLEIALSNSQENFENLYWGTVALLKTNTPRSKSFVEELFRSPMFLDNDLLMSLSERLN